MISRQASHYRPGHPASQCSHVAAFNGLTRNFKVFGGYSPGWFAYGSFFGGAVRQLLFAAVNGRKPRGLEITLDGVKYTRLIVSLDHPDAARTALTA